MELMEEFRDKVWDISNESGPEDGHHKQVVGKERKRFPGRSISSQLTEFKLGSIRQDDSREYVDLKRKRSEERNRISMLTIMLIF